MLKETTSTSSRTFHRRNPQIEPNENEFESSHNPINYPPPRTPLNSIPDPSQYQKEAQEPEADSLFKSEPVRPARYSSDRFGTGSLGLSSGTPRFSGRAGKSHSEPTSAQSTPARIASSSRVSLGGGGSRGRGVSSCALMKGISVTELCTEVPHFELKDDPSFWKDHNVQVFSFFFFLS